MGDNTTIRLVRIDGLLLIGSFEGQDLVSPRVIQIAQMPDGRMGIQFALIVGNPKRITLMNHPSFAFQAEDVELITAYREAVTGLTLAKNLPDNVIGMVRQ